MAERKKGNLAASRAKSRIIAAQSFKRSKMRGGWILKVSGARNVPGHILLVRSSIHNNCTALHQDAMELFGAHFLGFPDRIQFCSRDWPFVQAAAVA